MRPAVGRTWPMMHLIRVLLPLPLVPSRTTVSPPGTLMLTPESTRTSPYPACSPSMARLFAKVSPFDIFLLHDIVGRPVGDFAAGDDHDDALREQHDGAHDVFDQQYRNSFRIEAIEQRKDLIDFAFGKTGHDLVGDQQLRLRGERPAKLELPQFNLGQTFRAESCFIAEADLFEDDLRRFADRARRAVADRKPQRHLDVLLNRHSPERPRDLIGPSQPAPRPEPGRHFGNIVA